MLLPDTECGFSLPRPDTKAVVRRAALGAVLAGLLGASDARAATRPGVAVVDFRVTGVNAGLRHRLTKAVDGGVQAAGGDIVHARETAGAPAGPRSELGAGTGVLLVLRGSVEARRGNFAVHLEMLDTSTGQVLATKTDRCNGCKPDEACESVSLTASALLTDSRRALSSAAPEPPPPDLPSPPDAPDSTEGPARIAPPPAVPARIPVPDTAPTAAPGAELAPQPVGPATSRRGRPLAWAGVLGGLTLMGAGAAMIVLDGRCATDSPPGAACQDLWNTRWPGVALTVAGGGLAAAGALWLRGHRERTGLALVPGPGTLHLAGLF